MSKNQEIQGTIKFIGETQQVTDKFSKRVFVITTEDQYPQTVQFQAINNKCEDLNVNIEGQQVKVIFTISGKEWKNKEGKIYFFNSLNINQVIVIEKPEPVEPAQQKEPKETKKQKKEAKKIEELKSDNWVDDFSDRGTDMPVSKEYNDDLPF